MKCNLQICLWFLFQKRIYWKFPKASGCYT